MRELLASLPAAIAYLAGPDLVIDFANDAYRRLVGDRDVIGKPLREALPELAGQGRLELLGRILRTGESVRGIQTPVWIHRPGEERVQLFLDFFYQPVRGEDGAVAGILVYAADVTPQVRDRQNLTALASRLARTEERFRALFETMPQGVVQYSADGQVLGANPASQRILGLSESEMTTWPLANIAEAVHEDGTRYQPEELPVSRALRTGKVVTGQVLGIRHGRTGEFRWTEATAVPDMPDEQGRPQRAYVMFADVTEQRRVAAALRESTSLLGRLREANVLGVLVAGEERIYEANDAFLDIIGYSRADLYAGRISIPVITAPEWMSRDLDALRQLRTAGAFQPFEKEYVHQDGHQVPVVVGGAVISQDPLRWVTFVVDLTARQRAEDERAGLLVRERTAKAEADSAGERLTFLLRAGAMLAATRDRHELLEHAAQLVVPVLADHCVVFLPAADGTLHATSFAHRDPTRAPVLAEFRRHKIPAVGPMSIQMAYTTGTSQLLRDAEAQLPRWQDLAPGLTQMLARLRAASVLAVPLLVDQRPIGVLALARDAHWGGFAATDIEVVEEFARRLAEGIATADTFVREHTIAETLQRSVLPGTLPTIPGLDLAVSYLPASEGADVGGDWYDAFPLDGDRVGLVIGDVTGHNITSASMMGQVRSLLRAYAIDHRDPGEVLGRTNAALARLLPEALATAIYAVLDLATGELSYANAGHPPPLVTADDGRVDYLDGTTGTMLGACSEATFSTGHWPLKGGAVLLYYTDGLIENQRRDITEGLAVLAAAMQRCTAASAEQTCATVQSSLLGTGVRDDDVCLLAVRLPG